MQTQLSAAARSTPLGQEAADIIRNCVHCGFCTATCPTYQLLGDELDGPRGRIYIIKQVLEGTKPTINTQQHLDRCLSCRGCETTCPSGVQYGRLIDIGRQLVEEHKLRSLPERIYHKLLASFFTGPLFAPSLKFGQMFRSILPAKLATKIPRSQAAMDFPKRQHIRHMLLLAGCVQPAMMPNINAATAYVLDALGIQLNVIAEVGCCGAIHHHLNDHGNALKKARRNIDAWWPAIEAGTEAIVINASGCGTMVKDYGHLLRHDTVYADKAARVSALTRDLAEVVATHTELLAALLKTSPSQRAIFHPPCSLQHGQKIRGTVESILKACSAELLPFTDAHLCCGSAGTYSILQSEISMQLRDAKVKALSAPSPEVILSANVGCLQHIASGTELPVNHWVEWIAKRLSVQSSV
jgi:glycolate oxidase iron-sulfur subunit